MTHRYPVLSLVSRALRLLNLPPPTAIPPQPADLPHSHFLTSHCSPVKLPADFISLCSWDQLTAVFYLSIATSLLWPIHPSDSTCWLVIKCLSKSFSYFKRIRITVNPLHSSYSTSGFHVSAAYLFIYYFLLWLQGNFCGTIVIFFLTRGVKVHQTHLCVKILDLPIIINRL